MKYETVIGLEVHVQLKTRTKLFCRCAWTFGKEPNTLTCPVCTGQPGVLPVLNEEALALGIRCGLALRCEIPSVTRFDRKNYFYPDLPKGYQITQYEQPLARKGIIDVEGPDGTHRRIGIVRIHLEEDAGKTLHPAGEEYSLVDLNRAGVPLLEIVSEPDLRTPEEARRFLAELKRIMQYIEVSDCDMEKGSLRCDANISVRPAGARGLGTKTEIKNLNSFHNVEKALAFETARQREILERKGSVLQETRMWLESEQRTKILRSKEEAHDYRYFPEPDLPAYAVTPA
ncbi:MAG: Asp-tRNA(Asn)/Glu-tRNA(Gln) amidotransferase subunit GatB, partial [Planctomycetota bacterium]